METSLPRISVGTLNHLLHSFGKVGKIDTMMKVIVVGLLRIPCHIACIYCKRACSRMLETFLCKIYFWSEDTIRFKILKLKSGMISSYSLLQLFLKIVASCGEADSTTYAVLLKNLLAAGNWRKYIEVMSSNLLRMHLLYVK